MNRYFYFNRLGFHCPAAYNPADFYIKILSNALNSDTEDSAHLFFKTSVDTFRKPIDCESNAVENTTEFSLNSYKK